MKKIFTILAAVVLSSVANAQVLTSDNFSYNGFLNGNGWVTHSGTGGQLVAGAGVVSIAAGNSEDVNKAFSAPVTVSPATVTLSYSATVNFTNSTGLTTFGDHFLGFGATAGSVVMVFTGRLFVKGSATGYTLGILNTSGGTATPSYGTEVPYGTASHVVVTYTATTNTATLKIDSQTLLTNSDGTNPAPTSIASIYIRQGGTASSGTGNATIDDIVAANGNLAVSDLSVSKRSLVKSTVVNNTLMFSAKSDIQVVNMNGQVVKSASVDNNSTLDISSLPKGIYLVKGLVNGEQSVQKFMKN